MSKVLVTGGNGFLGQHIVQKLKREGKNIRIFSRKSSETNKENSEFETIWGDIRDQQAIDKAVEGVDYVIHLVSNFRKGGSDKNEANDINVVGTENVLASCLKHKVKRLVHCSTIGVHGSVLEIPAHEKTSFNPGDLYQKTKLLAEEKVWNFHRKHNFPLSVIRPISLLGPGDKRMLKLFKMIKNNRFIMVGKGDKYFQPAYIDDVVEGFYLCMHHEKAVGEAFIIGSEEYITLRKLVNLIAEELKVTPPNRNIPLTPVLWAASLCEALCVPFGVEPPLHRRRVSFFQNNRAFSIEKAKRIIGYQPEVSLREGIRKTINWYKENSWL